MNLQESYRIEFKRELNDSLEREVIAFLNNKQGGILYIGVDDDGNVIGIDNTDDIQLKIKDRIKNNISPSSLGLFDVILEREGKKSYIKVNIASGSEKPYFIKSKGMSEKGCFMRIGSSTEPMPQRYIDELYGKRTRVSLRNIKASKQELTFEQLKIYYQEKKLTLNDKFATNLELLTNDGNFNYVAYLLSDNNLISVRVAKYLGNDRVDLIENKEFGYCSIVKAAKQVLDKINLENRVQTSVNYLHTNNTPLWNPIAIKEAVINAFVHNDYTGEASPKFEIFTDRIEITSAGGLVLELSEEEFFNGYSIPRNKELIRIFKDLDMMEYLGSGLPRILKHYSHKSFNFTNNFLRVIFQSSTVLYSTQNDEKRTSTVQDAMQADHATTTQNDENRTSTVQDTTQNDKNPASTPQDATQNDKNPASTLQDATQSDKNPASTPQVRTKVIDILRVLNKEMSREEIQNSLKLKDRENFRLNYLNPAIEDGYIALKYPDSPRNPKQKYYLTEKGKDLVAKIREKNEKL